MLDLLQFMQQDGYLSANELIALRRTSKELGENPVRLLRSLNIASPEQIQIFLQKHFKVLILKEEALSDLSQDYQIFVPIDIALFYSCFGLGEENGAIYIAMEDPSDRGLINQLRFLLGKNVVGICATVYQLVEGLTKIYNLPPANLKLTTAIEKSRGVVGGIRYQESYDNSVQINENFAGIGLQDEETFVEQDPPAEDALESHEELMLSPTPPAESEPQSFDFIDGSSGNVDPDLLHKEEALGSLNSDLQEDNAAPSMTENNSDSDLQEDNSAPLMTENHLGSELTIELKQKISTLVNLALTKLSLTQKKDKAFETINTLLNPLNLSLIALEEHNFQLKGENLLISASLQNLEENSHPIYVLLIPVLKKIAKLK